MTISYDKATTLLSDPYCIVNTDMLVYPSFDHNDDFYFDCGDIREVFPESKNEKVEIHKNHILLYNEDGEEYFFKPLQAVDVTEELIK